MENSPKEFQKVHDTMLNTSDQVVDHLSHVHRSIYDKYIHGRVTKMVGENGANGLRELYNTAQEHAKPIAKTALKQMITKKFNSPIQNGSGTSKSHKRKSHKCKKY